MYTIAEAVEMGNAQELILSDIKEEFVADDNELNTLRPEESFDR